MVAAPRHGLRNPQRFQGFSGREREEDTAGLGGGAPQLSRLAWAELDCRRLPLASARVLWLLGCAIVARHGLRDS